MKRDRFSIAPGLVLDARRAVWLEAESVLAVADLHLGYAWAQRSEGNLFPIDVIDDALDRLGALIDDYSPREVIVLGDVVHKAVSLEPIRQELRKLCHLCSERPGTRLQLLAGNHDRALAKLLRECEIALPLEPVARIGPHVFLHGDVAPLDATPGAEGRIFMGHEHPTVSLGDGVTRVKCPAFLVSPERVVLPAFSSWAAGSSVRGGAFLSPLLQGVKFSQAVAILAGKVVPVPFN